MNGAGPEAAAGAALTRPATVAPPAAPSASRRSADRR